MSEASTQAADAATAQAEPAADAQGQPAGGPRTYTEEELDRIVKGRIDKQNGKHKSEMDKASADLAEAVHRAEQAEAERDALRAAAEARELRGRVAAEEGVPADLVSGEDEEQMRACAKRLSEFARSRAATYPSVGREDSSGGRAVTRDDVLAIKDPAKRVDAIAANLGLFK